MQEEKGMKRWIIALLGAGLILGLTGCGMKVETKFSKDGSAKTRSLAFLTDEELEGNADGTATYTMGDVEIKKENLLETRKVNGVTYNVFTNGWEDYNAEDEEQDERYNVISEKEFYYFPTELQDLEESESAFVKGMMEAVTSGYEFYDMSITFPYPVVCTNGTLSKDKKTVTFDVLKGSTDPEGMYAYTSKSKHFARLDKYITTEKVSVLCPIKTTSVTLNGKKVKDPSDITLSKDGEYTIKVKHKYGTETLTVVRDTVKPTISGAKNKQTYTKAVTLKFKDNTEFAYALVNDESVTDSSVKLSDQGTYDVKAYDTAGNMKRIKFTIK